MGLLFSVVPLALAAAITPTLIATQLLVIAQRDHWQARSLGVILANALAFGIVGFIAILGLAQLPDAGSGDGSTVDRILRLGGGVILLLASIWFFFPHPALAAKTTAALEKRLTNASIWVFFVAAFYFSITDLSSFVVLLPALHEVTASDIDVVFKAVVLAVVMFLALQGTILPALTRALFGRQVEPTLQRTYGWVMKHQFLIVGLVMAIIGVYLLVTAFTRR